MAVQPYLLILRNWASLMIFMRRPSTTTSRSVTKVDSVRMALLVVMFERLAKSSRAMYILEWRRRPRSHSCQAVLLKLRQGVL